MDGWKLDKWRENFTSEVHNLQIEFDAFFLGKKLDQFYELKINTGQNLSLEITNKDELPKEIEDRLTDIFLEQNRYKILLKKRNLNTLFIYE